MTLIHWGRCAVLTGRIEEARDLLDRGLEIARNVNHRRYQGMSCLYRAMLERRAGRLVDAEQFLTTAETIFRELGNRFSQGACACERGHLALALEQPARTLLELAEELAGQDLVEELLLLKRAIEARERGERLRNGEREVDLPEALLRTTVETATQVRNDC